MFLWTLCLALLSKMPRRYRPERHYMRGPGPKWQQKQAARQARQWWDGGH